MENKRKTLEPEHEQAFEELFAYIYKEDREATRLSMLLLKIAHDWDDLIDGEPLQRKDVNRLLLNCIFNVQQSPYWIPMGLNHHILNVFLRWRDSDTIERGDFTDEDLNKCFMLRAGIYDLFVIIAFYLHGEEWADEIGPVVRRFYGEKLTEYKEEMTCQIQQ